MAKKRKQRASSVDTSTADASSVQPSSVDDTTPQQANQKEPEPSRSTSDTTAPASVPSSGLDRRADELDDLPVDDTPRESEVARYARLGRLLREGVDAECCALLGIDLDVGPRAAAHAHPAQIGVFARGVGHAVWVSRIGAAIVEAGLSADELEHAAEWIREVREEG